MPDPRFEVLVSPSSRYARDPAAQSDNGAFSRLRIFTAVFLVTTLVGFAYTFLRPAVYRSTATLLVVPPASVQAPDTLGTGSGHIDRSRQSLGSGGSPDDNAAVQSQMLDGQSIIASLYGRLSRVVPRPHGLPGSLNHLENMLSVAPVKGTDMVELRAEGSPAALLPVLVNRWIDVYLKAYAVSQQNDANSARTALSDQIASLGTKIADKQRQLEAFRRQYDIVSIKRSENRALARLKGLNKSLDKADDEQAAAQANLAAARQAFARGDPTVRPQDQRALDALGQQIVALREQLSNYRELYTPAYLAMDQNIVALKKRLRLLEGMLRRKRTDSARAALSEARQAQASSRQAASQLRQDLAGAQKAAADFSARLAQYQTMVDGLQQLQVMRRSAQDKLVQIQVNSAAALPAVRVLERASVPGAPIRPRYRRDAGITLATALAAGLLSIWLVEFLTRSGRDNAAGSTPSALYTISSSAAMPAGAVRHLDNGVGSPPALAHAPARELSAAEVQAMLNVCDEQQRSLLYALLSGLSVADVTAMRWTDVNLEQGWLRGDRGRRFALPATLKLLWERAHDRGTDTTAPVWANPEGLHYTPAEADALIQAAAVYAGLMRPQEVDAAALRHTYLAFLARQGLGSAELAQVAGTLSEAELSTYRMLAPPGTVLPGERVNTVYPIFQKPVPDP